MTCEETKNATASKHISDDSRSGVNDNEKQSGSSPPAFDSRSPEHQPEEGWTWEALASQSDVSAGWTDWQVSCWKLARLIVHSVTNGKCEDIAQQVLILLEGCHVYLHWLDSDYMLPLHYAIKVGAALDVIQTIADKYPEAIMYGPSPSSLEHIAYCSDRNFERSALSISTDREVTRYLISRAVKCLHDPKYSTFTHEDFVDFFTSHVAREDGVIECLLDEYPGFAKMHASFLNEDTNEAELPLHYAVRNQAPIKVLERLVSAHPEALSEEGFYGRTPLHFACCDRSRASEEQAEVIRLLASPVSVRARDQFGNLALHNICCHENGPRNEEAIRMLVDLYPESVSKSNSQRKTPLHLACGSRYPISQDQVEPIRLLASPASVRARDENGNLALHIICLRDHDTLNVEVIRVLVDMNPESVAELNIKRQIPLHLLCARTPQEGRLTAIRYMVGKCPESLDVENVDCLTPLNVACSSYKMSNSEDLTVVQFLAASQPDSVFRDHCHGYSQLQIECERISWGVSSSFPLIKCLVESSPEAAMKLDEFDRSPIHDVCKYGEGGGDVLLAIELMVEMHPQLLRAKENVYGYTPLHFAVKNPCVDEDVIRFLVERCPEVLEPCEDGVETPLHLLCEDFSLLPKCVDSRMDILSISSKAVNAKNEDGRTPYHLLAQGGAPPHLLQILENVCPDLVRQRDARGQSPLRAAVARCIALEPTIDTHWESGYECECELYPEGADESYSVMDEGYGENELESDPDYDYESDEEWECDDRPMDEFKGVTHLIKAFPDAVNQVDNDGISPLMAACQAEASVDLIYELVVVNPIANLGLCRR